MKNGSGAVLELTSPVGRQTRHFSAVGDETRVGDTLDQRFKIIGTLARGGMSTIFKAEDLDNDGELVAIKIPDREVESKPALFSRFLREEQIGCGLDHPSVLRCHRVNGPRSRPYLVMEYVRGTTLFEHLKTAGVLPEKQALAMAARICDGLAYLRGRGVVHRDLKPENIMLCDDGGIRLMDFGSARASSSRRLTFMGSVPGTPHYMAPEQAVGQRGDARSDLYSLGAILYRMLTGKIAFDDADPLKVVNARVTGDPDAPRKLNPAISPQAEEIVLRAMDRDPDRRYATAEAMKADLDAPERVAVTGRSERLEATTPWKRGLRHARYIALWALVPVLAQIAVFFLLWRFLSPK